jgi:Na+-transporting methylmalonyl-CoA/oxaloacetate decarboxylase gamma subunit
VTAASVTLVEGILASIAGLGFVCAVTALFVVIARFAARRLLDEDDGSNGGNG